jgi:hypothetical protein
LALSTWTFFVASLTLIGITAAESMTITVVHSAPLNEPPKQTFYGGGDAGYLDYPTLDR